jgi:hypothetical protein
MVLGAGSDPPLFQRAQIRERYTYNSSATPKAGETSQGKVTMADVNLDELGAKIAETVEKADAEDPAKLRKRIAELEREIAARPTEPVEVEKVVEVPVFSDAERNTLHVLRECLAESSDRLQDALERTAPVFAALDQRFKAPSPSRTGATPQTGPSVTGTVGGSPRERAAGGGRDEATARPPAQPADAPDLPKVARELLSAVVDHEPRILTAAQAASVAGYKPRGSSHRAGMAALRKAGMVTEDSEGLRPTEAGYAAAGGRREAPLTREETIARWRQVLPRVAREMLDILLDSVTGAFDKNDLADAAGYEPGGSSHRAGMAALRKSGLIEELGADNIGLSEVLR